jgi:hypothetical protein
MILIYHNLGPIAQRLIASSGTGTDGTVLKTMDGKPWIKDKIAIVLARTYVWTRNRAFHEENDLD